MGKQEVPLKLALFKIVYLPTLLFNMEAWGRISTGELKDLEAAQGNAIKRLLNVPSSTSYHGIRNETGIWKVEHQLMYKRLMLYHNIINSNDDRVVKKLVVEQQKYVVKKSWMEKIKEDAEYVGLQIADFKKELKSSIKKKIKSAIEEKEKKWMEENITTKMRTVTKIGWGTKNYLKGEFSGDEVTDILKTKLHMNLFRGNYKHEGGSIECRLCRNEEETTEHIFTNCHILRAVRERIEVTENTLESDQKDECEKIVRFKRKCDLFLKPLPNKIE